MTIKVSKHHCKSPVKAFLFFITTTLEKDEDFNADQFFT